MHEAIQFSSNFSCIEKLFSDLPQSPHLFNQHFGTINKT